MPTMNPRITFTVSEEMMKEIEEYRFSRRKKNQTQAIVELINVGLEVMSGKEVQQEQKFTDEELRVVDAYNAADPVSRLYAMHILEMEIPEKKKNRA